LALVNPATALATVIVDELVAGGVREAVLCPGSRNAPLAFALHAADAAGRLRLHVRIDERGAGFLALGLAARSARPVPVTCTSGTAAANLHPAVLEAHHAGVPLLVLTADRPAELQDTGANQTVDQARLYGGALRWRRTLSTPGENGPWRAAVCQALAAAAGALTADPGPVHLNVELRQPLVPDGEPEVPARYAGRPGGRPWTRVRPVPPPAAGELELAARTLVVAGHGGPALPPWLAELPRVAEPGAPSWSGSLAAGPWLLRAWPGGLRPEQVVVAGRPTLHRAVQSLLADPAVPVTVLTDRPQWTDVAGAARAVVRGVPAGRTGPAPDQTWAAELHAAGTAASAAVQGVLAGTPWPTGLAVARDVVAALPAGALLVLGSSNPVRDVSLAACPRADLVVHANRGVAGIDGTVSTAAGAALAHAVTCVDAGQRGYALLGDLTLLHDATALMIGPAEPRPDLTITVANDDGGGIFSLLEQGEPRHAAAFERVFATPHGVRLAALCAAAGVPHTQAHTPAELAAALDPAGVPPGITVVEVRTRRDTLRELHERIATAVAAALAH
jgi:2-succinyl-5-enolpyruvyl-6-hydroxy-3-cyclohexene-1-carboxylate synthase